MSFCLEKHNVLEVGVVDVCVNSEQSFKDNFNDAHEIFWKRYSKLAWENFFIIELVFYPSH